MDPAIITAIAIGSLFCAVIGYFLFGLILKILWGWWPFLLSFAVGGWAIWELGFEYIWMLSIPILGSVVGSWLWQRTNIFLSVDSRIEKLLLMGD